MVGDYNIVCTFTKVGILILCYVRFHYLTSVLATEHNHTDQFSWKEQIIGDHDKYDKFSKGCNKFMYLKKCVFCTYSCSPEIWFELGIVVSLKAKGFLNYKNGYKQN